MKGTRRQRTMNSSYDGSIITLRSTLYAVRIMLLLAILLFQSCSEQKVIARKVQKEFRNSAVADKYYVGFALYDLANARMIYSRNGHRYFTPASNTKLYTFYASLKMLPEVVSALRYEERGDSLIFWGTGDPSFFQQVLKGKQAYNFLASSQRRLFFAPGRYTGDFYGAGWQWDDYNDYYQPEINELPIGDNMLTISGTSDGGFSVMPPNFRDSFVVDSAKKSFSVVRDFTKNIFRYPIAKAAAKYNQQVPYKLSPATTLSILADTLHKPVGLVIAKMPATARMVPGMQRDSILKAMMLPSDNFIAEHLLLLCSDQLGAELNTKKAIAYIEKTFLHSLPDKPVWVDGSGLSRYNLFTPADMVSVLELIFKEFKDPNKLFDMLPAGGKRGTLKNAYPATASPFVFGKTGTVSNNHNQSGYVVTKKGKVYAYAFMNNNFVVPTADVRREMARIITFIHENF